MKTFLVGGAVREELLGQPINDRDWCVVGETPENLLALGFKQVGAAFAIFLHPETNEEYALARTERKIGPGHTGFSTDFTTSVTIEQDLARRDLTINAIAQDQDGNYIDPFSGIKDLKSKTLRHVSEAFSEDPLRVLRVARFAARYPSFSVASETMELMGRISQSGELNTLSPERLWKEFSKALTEKHPSRFIEILQKCGALKSIAPEIDCLFGIPQPEKHHPEIDTGTHLLMALDQVSLLTDDTMSRFGVLVHDLGKGASAQDNLPNHHGHEEAGIDLIRDLCARIKAPNEYRDFGCLVSKYHTHCHRAKELRPRSFLKVLVAINAFHQPDRLEQFLYACEADARGRKGLEDNPYPQSNIFREAFNSCKNISAKQMISEGYEPGPNIGHWLKQRRILAIRNTLETLDPASLDQQSHNI